MSGLTSWKSATVCWRLDGPAGHLDTFVAALIDCGFTVEVITVGTAYRVTGDATRLQAIADQLGEAGGEIKLGIEIAPTDVVNLRGTLAPARPFRRSVIIHGSGPAFGYVARAIDSGTLTVASVGQCRFEVRGRTADLLVWLSEHVHHRTIDEVLSKWNMTVESARAEDVDLPPVPTINIVMPSRKKETTHIKRNDDGEIISVEQIETDVKDDDA